MVFANVGDGKQVQLMLVAAWFRDFLQINELTLRLCYLVSWRPSSGPLLNSISRPRQARICFELVVQSLNYFSILLCASSGEFVLASRFFWPRLSSFPKLRVSPTFGVKLFSVDQYLLF